MKVKTQMRELMLHYQEVLDALSSYIAILDEKSNIIAVNKAWRFFCEERGIKNSNAGIGKNYLSVCGELFIPETFQSDETTALIRKILANELTEGYVEYSCCSSTEKRWYQVKFARFSLGQNSIIVIHQDITRRKLAEESLRESEWKFRSIVEQSAQGFTLINQEGKVIEWNVSQEKITGLKKENVLGRYVWEVLTEVTTEDYPDALKLGMKTMIMELLEKGTSSWTGRPSEYEIIKPDGTRAIVESVVFPIKYDHGFLACSMTTDITELNIARKSTTISEKKFRTYVDFSPVMAFVIDQQGTIIDTNPATSSVLGYTVEELKTMKIQALIPPDDNNFSSNLRQELLATKQSVAEIRMLNKDHERITVSSSAVVLPDGNILVMCTDITELKQTHDELRESEEFLSSILDNIPSLISVKDAETLSIRKVNRKTSEFLGKSVEEVIGEKSQTLLSDQEADQNNQIDRLALNENKIIDHFLEVFSKKDHNKHVFHQKKIPVYDQNHKPRYVLSISEDITDQVKLEAEADSYLSRLEAVSKLSTELQTIQTLDELYPMLLKSLIYIVKGSLGSIWLYDSEKDELLPVYQVGDNEDHLILTSGSLKPGKGIPGMVYLSRKPYVSYDYNSDPYLSENKRGNLKNKIGGVTLPLRTSNSVLGAVNISFIDNTAITDQDVRLLTTLSEVAGNAIQNIKLREQTEQRLMHITALGAIDRAITSSFDIQVSLEILVRNVIEQLKVDASSVLLFNPHSQLLEYSNGQGFKSDTVRSVFLRLGESFAGKVAQTREPLFITDLSLTENVKFEMIRDKEEFHTYFGVPLIAKGQLKGVLEAFTRFVFEPGSEWINFYQSLAEQASIAIDNMQMFDNLQRSNTELSLAYNATIEGWSRALDLRDKETEGHTQRVTEITVRLARAFQFPDNQIKYIRWGALLHDIGKLGVPDGILLKPGPLTDEEWVIMRMHPRYAYEMLAPIGYLSQAIDIPYSHHEKWDGTGYPRGLSGEQIPLSARIFAVVDIWDALSSDRPYRSAWPEEKVIEHIRSLSGTHLDPKVVDFCLNSGVFSNLSR